MKIAPLVVAATSFALAWHPLQAQSTRFEGAAVTRVATPLRESPDIDARALLTIPPKTDVTATSCDNGWCAVRYKQVTGHAIQVFLRFAPVEALQSLPAKSGRGYINFKGDWIPSPRLSADGQPPAGSSAQCRDKTYSFSRSRSGTCSHHGGVARWL